MYPDIIHFMLYSISFAKSNQAALRLLKAFLTKASAIAGYSLILQNHNSDFYPFNPT